MTVDSPEMGHYIQYPGADDALKSNLVQPNGENDVSTTETESIRSHLSDLHAAESQRRYVRSERGPLRPWQHSRFTPEWGSTVSSQHLSLVCN